MPQPKQAIVVTGALGFVGTHALDAIKESQLDSTYTIIGVIRPGTLDSRKKEYDSFVTFIEFDFKKPGLDALLASYRVAWIIHLAAVIHTNGLTKEEVISINYRRTKELTDYSLQHACKLLYCSSVGVYGSIPSTVPAQINTSLVRDTLYHATKIDSENYIQKQQRKGLQAMILRPSILYGKRDTGFLYKIASFLKKGWFLLPNQTYFIHLTSVTLFGRVCTTIIQNNYLIKDPILVVDKTPVALETVCHAMAEQLSKKVRIVHLPVFLFRLGEAVSARVNSVSLSGKLKRISRSWYFDTSSLHQIVSSQKIPETIPELKKAMAWYLKDSESKTI